MIKTVLDEITPVFSYLFGQHGFQKIEDVYDPNHFGDALLVFQSNDLRLRFVRDRGQVFVDVGPRSEPDKWYSLPDVLEFLRSTETHGAFSSALDLKDLADNLRENYQGVREVFSRENYSATGKELEEFARARSRQLINELLKESKADK